jgi:two-component system phosphate regulon response regulator PhoB
MSHLILIVDDERDLVSTLSYNLEQEGYQTRTAYTGKEAVAAAATAPIPDLVLLDLMLPDLTGVEVCKQLRANEQTRKVPVIMLTAKGDEIDRVVGFEVGADDYVVKPFSVRELLLRIRAILRRSQTVEQAGTEVSFERLRVDAEGHRVWVDGEEI